MTLDIIMDTARSLWGLWLMAIFLGIIAWVLWPKHSRQIEEHRKIPFKDEER